MLATKPVFRRALVTTILGAAVLAFVAAPAWAHAELLSSDPTDGATVDALPSVRLEFSEDLLDIGNSVTVTDSAGTTQNLELTFPEPNVIAAAVAEVAPGAVEIDWRNASVDGHTEEGTINVTVSAPPVTTPTPSPSASETEASATPSPSVSAVAIMAPISPTATPVSDGSSGVSPWLLALLGVLVIGGIAAAIVAATRRTPPVAHDAADVPDAPAGAAPETTTPETTTPDSVTPDPAADGDDPTTEPK